MTFVAFQRLPMTRGIPTGRYAVSRLRTLAEAAALLARHGLADGGTRDFRPRSIRSPVAGILARRSGRIGDDEIEALVGFVLAPKNRPQVGYLSHARKGRL